MERDMVVVMERENLGINLVEEERLNIGKDMARDMAKVEPDFGITDNKISLER
jgi:hypothetical protein